MNLHANKIQTALAAVHQRGRFEHLEPPSILVETRRLLEKEKLEKAFPKVKLYSDWCVHCLLDRDGAANVLVEITAALNNSVRNSSTASVNAVYAAVCSALAIEDFQKEMILLYRQHGVDARPLGDASKFQQFMSGILDTIAGLPLCFPSGIATKTGKVRKIYDDAYRIAANDPNWTVVECLVTNLLSEGQLAFYNVPNGAYLWQITTGAGVAYCGVLQV